MIWFQLSESTHGRTAFIFDFKIEEGHQGKGYGRQAMESAGAGRPTDEH